MEYSDKSSIPTTTLTSRAAMWGAFVTVFVICPWAMVALWAALITSWFGGAGFPTNMPVVRDIPSPVWAALLIWFVHSLGVSVWTQCRNKSSLIGLIIGWLLVSFIMVGRLPEMIKKLVSSADTTELLRATLSTVVLALGWLVSGTVIVQRCRQALIIR
jgi:hypothetical protein